MLEDVESEGFQFNPQNDTLLFYVSFCSWWAPCDLVVKTSAGISHYYQPPQEESFKIDSVMLAKDFFISSILYYGDNSAFTDFSDVMSFFFQIQMVDILWFSYYLKRWENHDSI